MTSKLTIEKTVDFYSTLNKRRTIPEIFKEFNVSRPTLAQWKDVKKTGEQNKENILMFLYLERVNVKAIEKYVYKYDEVPMRDILDDEEKRIEIERVMSALELYDYIEGLKNSRLRWKKNVYEVIMKSSIQLFFLQIKGLEAYKTQLELE